MGGKEGVPGDENHKWLEWWIRDAEPHVAATIFILTEGAPSGGNGTRSAAGRASNLPPWQPRAQLGADWVLGVVVAELRATLRETCEHMYGCRVVQRILEHGDDRARAVVLETVVDHCVTMAQHQYATYVVQHVVQHGPHSAQERIAGACVASLEALSTQKFGSAVVERLLEAGSDRTLALVTNEIIRPRRARGTCILDDICTDRYGNFVVQKLLDRAPDAAQPRIRDILRACRPSLEASSIGAHILARLDGAAAAATAHTPAPEDAAWAVTHHHRAAGGRGGGGGGRSRGRGRGWK